MSSSVVGELEVGGLSSDQIGIRASEAGITLYELVPVKASLEEAFMELTRDAVDYRSPAPTRNGPASETEQAA